MVSWVICLLFNGFIVAKTHWISIMYVQKPFSNGCCSHIDTFYSKKRQLCRELVRYKIRPQINCGATIKKQHIKWQRKPNRNETRSIRARIVLNNRQEALPKKVSLLSIAKFIRWTPKIASQFSKDKLRFSIAKIDCFRY